MTVPHRCTIKRRCGKYVTLAKPIDEYKRRPLCPGCGKDTLKPWYYGRIRDIENTCKCRGVSFPHKRGYIRSPEEFCEHAEFDPHFGPIKSRVVKPDEECPF